MPARFSTRAPLTVAGLMLFIVGAAPDSIITQPSATSAYLLGLQAARTARVPVGASTDA